jgi:chitinase
VLEQKKRDEKRFAKKLVRLAKYLEFKGLSGGELSSMLLNEEKTDLPKRVRKLRKAVI